MRAGIIVKVTRADRHRLEAIVSDRSAPQKHVWRANIILATADGCGTAEIMRRSGKSKPVVWRWQARFMAEGVEGLTRDKTRKPGKPPLPTGTVQRVVELALAPPPGANNQQAGGAPAADPSGVVSLFDAFKNELGLKLEKEKRPMPVLVIDHIEEQPTAN